MLINENFCFVKQLNLYMAYDPDFKNYYMSMGSTSFKGMIYSKLFKEFRISKNRMALEYILKSLFCIEMIDLFDELKDEFKMINLSFVNVS